MKLIFRLRFHTQVGQSLFLTGNHDILGGGRIERAFPLHYLNADFWQATFLLPAGDRFLTLQLFTITFYAMPTGRAVQDWGSDRASIHRRSNRMKF